MDWNKITDEQFAEAAKEAPWAAIVYANDRLTDEQFAEAAKAEPGAAIVYANDRLTDEQFAEAAKEAPWVRSCTLMTGSPTSSSPRPRRKRHGCD